MYLRLSEGRKSLALIEGKARAGNAFVVGIQKAVICTPRHVARPAHFCLGEQKLCLSS